MASAQPTTNGRTIDGLKPRGAYEEATLGFREYWWPVCVSGEISTTPKAFMLLGDPVAILRRAGKAYAIKDECPHRGTEFSMINTRKNWEFPGTCTITCPYHGWTFDVSNGRCVAVISEGPESPVPNSGVRVKTYPVEERLGLIWIWMGQTAPVPVDEDIPNLLLDPKAVVKAFYRVKWGNWRFHAENVAAGHAGMVHKSTFRNWFGKGNLAAAAPPEAEYFEDADGKGIITLYGQGGPDATRMPSAGNRMPPRPSGPPEFPGVGVWHLKPRWQRTLLGWFPGSRSGFGRPVQGIQGMMLMLPGLFRVPNFPNIGYMYYEWYVPVDEENYIYFQIMAFWPKNWLARIRWELKYYFWDRPTGPVLFNNQDAAMVAQTTKYYKRTGNLRYLTKVSKNDELDVIWRKYCDEEARVVGSNYGQQSEPAAEAVPEAALASPVVASGG